MAVDHLYAKENICVAGFAVRVFRGFVDELNIGMVHPILCGNRDSLSDGVFIFSKAITNTVRQIVLLVFMPNFVHTQFCGPYNQLGSKGWRCFR